MVAERITDEALNFIYLKNLTMKWKTQHGKTLEISDMDDNHARNSINMLIRNSSPQVILELICEANEARRKHNEELRNRKKFAGLNGDMAQQFNSMSRDMEEWGDYPHDEFGPFDGL